MTGSPPPPAIPVRLVVGAVTFSIFALNTVFWCLLLYVIALVKLLVPAPPWRRLFSRGIVWIAERWIAGNALGLRLTQRTRWEVTGLEDLEGLGRDTSVLVVSNHQSAVDIPVLQTIFLGKIPFLRFLLKKILIWVPFLGPAWWALDFPFMKRYSREFLEKHPEKRIEDLEATRRACERFADLPVSILSFAEGTRFTPEKKRRSSSPFRNLLAPKTGGLAFTVSALGATLRAIVDVTIVYPAGRPTFWDAISQGVPRIVVKVRQVEIPDDWFAGDYQGDAAFRGRVQAFVQKLWQEKDALIDAVS